MLCDVPSSHATSGDVNDELSPTFLSLGTSLDLSIVSFVVSLISSIHLICTGSVCIIFKSVQLDIECQLNYLL